MRVASQACRAAFDNDSNRVAAAPTCAGVGPTGWPLASGWANSGVPAPVSAISAVTRAC